MDADVQGCLNQIDKSLKAFSHNNKRMTKNQVRAVLEFAKSKGYKAVSELSSDEIDYVLITLDN